MRLGACLRLCRGGAPPGPPAGVCAGWGKKTPGVFPPARKLLGQRGKRDWGACDLHAVNGPGGASPRQSLCVGRSSLLFIAGAPCSEGPQTTRTLTARGAARLRARTRDDVLVASQIVGDTIAIQSGARAK